MGAEAVRAYALLLVFLVLLRRDIDAVLAVGRAEGRLEALVLTRELADHRLLADAGVDLHGRHAACVVTAYLHGRYAAHLLNLSENERQTPHPLSGITVRFCLPRITLNSPWAMHVAWVPDLVQQRDERGRGTWCRGGRVGGRGRTWGRFLTLRARRA